MMHTPQQRQGGPRYGPGVLVGGFYEDTFHRTSAMAALLATAADGAGLKSTRWQERVSAATAPVPIEGPASDGLLREGDLVQLLHAPSGCALAVNEPDPHRAPGGAECHLPSATAPGPAAASVVRTTLLLAPYRPPRPSPVGPASPDGVVRYGCGVHVVARHPAARGAPLEASCWADRPLYLASQPAAPMRAARYSRHQPVAWSAAAPGWGAVWVPQPVEPAERAVVEGLPVPCDAPLLLVHAATNVPLCLESGVVFPTDFGPEHEVTAHLVTKLGQQMGLEHCARGDDLRALPKRPLEPNHFVFSRLGALPREDRPLDGAAATLGALAEQLAARPGALAALDSALRGVCDAGGDCAASDALLALRQAGAVGVGADAVADLAAAFPSVGGGPGRLSMRLVAAELRQRVEG